MTFDIIFFLVIIFALIYGPPFITRGYTRFTASQLREISDQYSGIKWAYWGWSAVLFPLMIVTMYGSWILSFLYPSVEIGLRLMGGVIAIAYVPLYQALFALIRGVYPISKSDEFVLAETGQIKILALRGIILVFLVVCIALVIYLGIKIVF